ncbi:hypothetical protein YC2023_123071 [Brassica napus]
MVIFNRNLSGNNLSGSLPQALQRKGLEVVVQGNPRLCLSDPCRKIPNKKALVPIVASISSAVIVIAILNENEVVFFLYTGIQLPPRMSIDTLADSREPSFDQKSRRFTYSEVIQMTNNFQKVLGKGGFGVVYYGTVNGSEQVAVKVLSQFSTQGYKEFKAEVLLLIRVHHTNLVRLVGYCYEGDHFALIYEFLPNGNLKEHLAGKGGKPIINWGIRLQIALDAALGDINGIMDPNLCGVYDTSSAWRALELAMSCADPHSTNRPTMSRVVIELKECLACEKSEDK